MSLRVSVVIPVYFAEKTIHALVKQVFSSLPQYEVEVILVNDGSRDRSAEICCSLAKANSAITFINLRKNFGEHNAVMCGLHFVTGDVAVIIDDDFQNPPEEIPKLIAGFEEGYDVIYSAYAEKQHSPYRNFFSRVNDRIATILLQKPKNLYLSSFKAVSAPLVREILKYTGPFPYIDGLILRVTDNIGTKQTLHQKRAEGHSNYTFKKLLSLHLNMFLNFSILPLRLCSLFGVLAFVLGFLLSALFVIEKAVNPDIPLGWTSIITALLMLSGVQLLSIGMLGEYLGKQYLDQNKTPQWVIKDQVLNSFHTDLKPALSAND